MSAVEGWIWFPHDELVWTPALIRDNSGGLTEFQLFDKSIVRIPHHQLDPTKLERVSPAAISESLDNLVNLDEITDGAVIHQLRERYLRETIYSLVGNILISINPYQLLAGMYTTSMIEKYKQDYINNSPHVFAIAAEAYHRICEDRQNQAVIISGESGAGKTEATKTVLQYLSEVAGSAGGVENSCCQEILQSNPLLEAFGNAKTLRNNNSSRFGKYMEVKFEQNGRICSARIVNYLLEKSRVVNQSVNERNYHIFYQFLAGLNDDERIGLNLESNPEFYNYLKQSKCYSINGVDDRFCFDETFRAMKELKFSEENITSIMKVLASILQLGNLELTAQRINNMDGTIIGNVDLLTTVSQNLGFSTDALLSALTYRSVTIRNELSMIPLNVADSNVARDAFAKALYGKLFDWLVRKINATLYKVDSNISIGILDIFGFEIFDNNQFEQFCINFANEKLQQHFNSHVFRLELQLYQSEGIDVAQILFVDNLECLELIEKRPTGVLAMLDEEVRLPSGSDKAFILKLHQAFAPNEKNKHKHFDIIKKSPNVFVIRHYAGDVVYNSDGLLAKNRDRLHDTLEALVPKSTMQIICQMFNDDSISADLTDGGGRGSIIKAQANTKKVQTLGSQFANQLTDLMHTLHQCNPHYIRCIKPNPDKLPNHFATKMVLRQMQYAGLFEAIRIRKSGFSFQKEYKEFIYRYRVLVEKSRVKEMLAIGNNYKSLTEFILVGVPELDRNEWQLGKTKLFMRSSQRIILDRIREIALTKKVTSIQAVWRMYSAKKLVAALKLISHRAEQLIGSRDRSAVHAMLSEAEEKNYELFVLTRLEWWLQFMDEEVTLIGKLKRASEGEDIQLLSSNIDSLTKLLAKFPREKFQAGPELMKQVEIAKERKARLEYLVRVRLELQEAINSEEIPRLTAAIEEGKRAGLMADELSNAEELLQHLIAEEAVMERLRQAERTGSVDEIENCLSAAYTIALDESRRSDIKRATECLKSKYSELLRECEAAKDESRVVEFFMPKFTALQFHELLQQCHNFVAEQERLREEERQRLLELERQRRREEEERLELERQRIREEERIREEARLAEERKNLAESEKLRLEAIDRQRREEEERREAAIRENNRREREERDRMEAMEDAARNAPPPPMPEFDDIAPPPPDFDDSIAPPPPMDDDSDLPPPPPSSMFSPIPGPPSSLMGSVNQSNNLFGMEDDEPDLPPPPSGFAPAPGASIPAKAAPLPPSKVAFLPPPPPIDRGSELDLELENAIKSRDLHLLVQLVASAEALRHNSRVFRVAQNLIKTMQEMSALAEKLNAAIEAFDIEKLKELLKKASQLGMEDQIVAEARHMAYSMSQAELLSARISKAVDDKLMSRVQELLREAVEENIETEEVEHARDWVAVNSQTKDWNATVRASRSVSSNGGSASAASNQLIDAYCQFMACKGTMPLSSFVHIRRQGNYAKRNYFSKKDLKENMFHWQKDDIPRSLVKLSTAYCGNDKKKSKQIKEICHQIFKNIRGYMGDLYHQYPASLALEVINTGVQEPLLRDEIFCEIMKQTTKNPSEDSNLLGLKLFYLCISTFKPSNELISCIFSHLSQWAHTKLPADQVSFATAADVATNCFVIFETATSRISKDATAASLKVPSMQDIEKLTKGILTAKASHRRESMNIRGSFNNGAKAMFTQRGSLIAGQTGPPTAEQQTHRRTGSSTHVRNNSNSFIGSAPIPPPDQTSEPVTEAPPTLSHRASLGNSSVIPTMGRPVSLTNRGSFVPPAAPPIPLSQSAANRNSLSGVPPPPLSSHARNNSGTFGGFVVPPSPSSVPPPPMFSPTADAQFPPQPDNRMNWGKRNSIAEEPEFFPPAPEIEPPAPEPPAFEEPPAAPEMFIPVPEPEPEPEPVYEPIVSSSAPPPPDFGPSTVSSSKSLSLGDQLKNVQLKKKSSVAEKPMPASELEENRSSQQDFEVSSVGGSSGGGLHRLTSSANTAGIRAMINARMSVDSAPVGFVASSSASQSKPAASDDWDDDDDDVAHSMASRFNRVHETSLLPPKPEEPENLIIATGPRVNESSSKPPVNEERISVSAAKGMFGKAAVVEPIIVPKSKIKFNPNKNEEKKIEIPLAKEAEPEPVPEPVSDQPASNEIQIENIEIQIASQTSNESQIDEQMPTASEPEPEMAAQASSAVSDEPAAVATDAPAESEGLYVSESAPAAPPLFAVAPMIPPKVMKPTFNPVETIETQPEQQHQQQQDYQPTEPVPMAPPLAFNQEISEPVAEEVPAEIPVPFAPPLASMNNQPPMMFEDDPDLPPPPM